VLRVGRREEGGGSDGWGPVGSDVRGNTIDGLRKLKEEAPFGKYAKAAQAEWAEWAKRAQGGLRVKRPGLLGAGPIGPESVTPTFYKNKIFCPHRCAYKMHIKF
jgi:hypothetical protein